MFFFARNEIREEKFFFSFIKSLLKITATRSTNAS